MKRFIFFTLAFMCAVCVYSMEFRAVSFATKSYAKYGWTEWSESSSNVLIIIDDGVVSIYSSPIQRYTLYDPDEDFGDIYGDSVLSCRFIDQDGDRGTIDIMYRAKYGMFQLYVRYRNVQWVYDMKIIKYE